jgi:uncharacterized protein
MATRRAFLAGMAAAALPRLTWADAGSPAYVAAAKTGDAFALYGLTAEGAAVFTVPLPARGHAAAAHPTRPEVVAFARRPGTFALVMNAARGTVAHRLAPPDGMQFNGHGTFSADGAVLYTSEQRAAGSEGRLGLWAADDSYRRIGDLPTGGIGPHDILRDGDTLWVANGGIDTDPDDRTKLNIATMAPSLVRLGADGAVLDDIRLPADLHQLSIRHLALAPGGLAFAMQWEGDAAETPPLLGLWADGKVILGDAGPEAGRMRNYTGSIACAGEQVVLTSPPGGIAACFGLDGALRQIVARTDVSGVARRGSGFILTDGTGAVTALHDGALDPLATGGPQWDNHLIAIG